MDYTEWEWLGNWTLAGYPPVWWAGFAVGFLFGWMIAVVVLMLSKHDG